MEELDPDRRSADAPWRASLSRTAVLVIDLQEAFLEDPSLAAHREELVAHTAEVLAWARTRDLLVVNVCTKHRRDGSTWTITMLEDEQGFLFDGDEHTANLHELDLADAVQVTKTRDDAFVDTALRDLLQSRGIEAVVVLGVSTHTCVLLTAAHAFAEDLEVVLVRDAIASHRPELHELTLDVLRDEYRFPLVSAHTLSRIAARPEARQP